MVIGSWISFGEGQQIKKNDTLAQWDPYNVPILTEKAGRVEFRDMIPGVTMKRETDETTGVMGTVVIEHKEGDLHPQVVLLGDKKTVIASYSIPAGAHVIVEEGKQVQAGSLLAKTPAQDRQDEGHHGRTAARGGTLRGASSEGRLRDRQD